MSVIGKPFFPNVMTSLLAESETEPVLTLFVEYPHKPQTTKAVPIVVTNG